MPSLAGLERPLLTILPSLGKTSRPLPMLYLLASLVGPALLAITGYLGGSMVYDNGVGTPSGVIPALIGALYA
jgi:uncharacterized membrane protein